MRVPGVGEALAIDVCRRSVGDGRAALGTAYDQLRWPPLPTSAPLAPAQTCRSSSGVSDTFPVGGNQDAAHLSAYLNGTTHFAACDDYLIDALNDTLPASGDHKALLADGPG